MGEFELIERFFSRPGGRRDDVVSGVGDDAAIVRVPAGNELIVAADSIVSGVHFPPDLSPEFIGYRALAVNLSDMAAMGAAPAWCTLSLTLPAAQEEWLQRFTEGFLQLATKHGVALVGGDTTSGPLTVCVQILGLAPAGKAIRRSGAKVGDAIFVSGFVGDAAAGLTLLGSPPAPPLGKLSTVSGNPRLKLWVTFPEEGREEDRYLAERFLKPQARVGLGLALRGVASAAIDVSDGLLADLGKLVNASGVGARIELEQLPLSQQLLAHAGVQGARSYALNGGDDYELCFTAPVERVGEVEERARVAGVECRRIGVVEKEAGVRCYEGGQLLDIRPAGFDHFQR